MFVDRWIRLVAFLRKLGVTTIRPTTMIDLYATPGLKDVAREVETTLEAIMAEAAKS